MKFFKKAAAILLSAVVVTGLYFTVGKASSAEPGSSGDPVVTKSYVDQKISELTQLVTSLTNGFNPVSNTPSTIVSGNVSNEELMLQIDFIVQERMAETVSATFKTLSIPMGKRIVATAEGTEFILRSGGAIIVGGENGLADVTDGKDLLNAQQVPSNHHLISPRVGRGLSFTKDSWIMVRGAYEIK